MKEPQNHEPEAGYSEQKLWPFYILYSTLSLIALSVSYAWIWIVLINVVSFYLMVRIARWENKTFNWTQDWYDVGGRTEIVTTRTRIAQPEAKPVVARKAKPKQTVRKPVLATS